MNTYSKAVFILFAFIFISCDKDFNTLGSDVVGNEHFDFEQYTFNEINAYTKFTNAVQSNNLTINMLGIYDNPDFGTTKAHIVSQIEMTSPNPYIGYNHFIDSVKDSVYVYIPYFSTIESTDSEGANTYTLDSVYGNTTNGKIDLKIYENGYFLNSFDPLDDFVSSQKYYTDDKSKITTNIVSSTGILNDSSNPLQNTEVTISNSEHVIYKTNGNGVKITADGVETTDPLLYVVKERKAPGLWINLNKLKFKERILDEVNNGKLFNNNVFKQHFKGLYFEIDNSSNDEGFLAKLDLTKAEVVMQFHYYSTAQIGTPNPDEALKSSIRFRMGYAPGSSVYKSNNINLIETTQTQKYSDAINEISTPMTQGKLFLKGGANGTIAFIDLFGSADVDSNGIPDELDDLRTKGWLINEANLVFYVDQAQMTASSLVEPDRIYLYDVTNNTIINDYANDGSVVSTNPKRSKFIYGGIGEKSSDGKMLKYKFRITDYINRLIKTTDTSENLNIRLGLVVTESINRFDFVNIKTPITIGTDQVGKVPVASVMNPFGIILHGPQSTDSEKKLKLEIYYTKPY